MSELKAQIQSPLRYVLMVSHTNAIFRLPQDVTVNLPVGRLTLGGRVSKRCSAQLKVERKSSSPDITHTLHKLQHSTISLELKEHLESAARSE